MKKWLLVTVVAMLLLGFSACGGGSDTGSTPSAPAIYKVRMWVTLSNNPDAPSVTTLTSAQTVQASIWARGTTEKTITFKVNLCYDDKFTTLVNGVRTESSSKAVSVGAGQLYFPGNFRCFWRDCRVVPADYSDTGYQCEYSDSNNASRYSFGTAG